MIARDCALASYEDGRIHLQHLSARESVDAIADAKARGLAVTCETSPHHLTMIDEDVRTLDTARKMNPPLREAADRDALIEVLRSGVIDCIATDHAPHARDEKEIRSSRRRWGRPAWRPRSPRSTRSRRAGDAAAGAGRREAHGGAGVHRAGDPRRHAITAEPVR